MADVEDPPQQPVVEKSGDEVDANQAAEGEQGDAPQGDAQTEDPAAGAVEAAAAAAAAVAAKFVEQHEQTGYPGDGGEGNNKRPREEDGHEDGLGGPEKKHASSGMLSGAVNDGGAGADPAAADGDPPEPLSEVFEVSTAMVGKIIGKAGETIRTIQQTTSTRIQIDHSGEGPNKSVTISGYTQEQIDAAKAAINALDATEDVTQSIECPQHMVGRIIGRGGETIRALQAASEAHVTVNQDFPEGEPRQVIVSGRADAVERASLMVKELIHGEPGSAQAVIQRVCQEHGIGKSHTLTAPKSLIGRIIGRGGETIKTIQKGTGATVQIEQAQDPCRITIAGQNNSADHAKQLIEDILGGADPFAIVASLTGGGGQAGGYGAPGGYGGQAGYGMQGGYGAQAGYGGQYGGAAAYGGGGYGAAAGYGGGYPGYGAQGGYGGYAAQGAADPYAAAYGAGGGYGGGYPGQQQPGGDAGAAAGPWQELHDDQGRAYYYNSATGVTQWERPADF